MIPIGRFTKKTERHPKLSMRGPPRSGPKTEAAVQAISDVPASIKAFGARRHVVYEDTRGFTRFGKDWERRDAEITAAALKMTTDSSAPVAQEQQPITSA